MEVERLTHVHFPVGTLGREDLLDVVESDGSVELLRYGLVCLLCFVWLGLYREGHVVKSIG